MGRCAKYILTPVYLGILGTISCLNDADAAIHERIAITPEPAWVSKIDPDPISGPSETNSSERIRLFDLQYHVTDAARFQRINRHILTEAGVQNGSRLTFVFDPAYSRLDLHRVEVRRRGQVINQLAAGRVQVLQREKELERHLYDGQLSAVIFLEDVRVGDEIDYSYTKTGRNPVFVDKFSESVFLKFPYAIDRYAVRVVSPANRPLHFYSDGSADPPSVTESSGSKIYSWDVKSLPLLLPEPGLPRDYMPYSRMTVTEFNSWEEVSAWAARVFAFSTNLPPELEALITQWKALSPDPETRAIAALEFVQDQIRYLGIESGEHSHAPSAPAAVFTRRFGDCKEKAVLLSTIFRRLGIEAYPALVNSNGRIDERAPSPLAFDHCIVQAKLGGTNFWLDGTRSFQRGSFGQRYLPDFRYALAIGSQATALTPIPNSGGGLAKSIVRESLTISGTNNASQLRVVTTLEGRDAEEFRAALSDSGRDAIAKTRLNSYSRHYPMIQTNGAFEIRDNTNSIQTIESYLLPELWQRDRFRFTCDLYAQSIAELLDLPGVSQRTMPLAIDHPCQRVHTMTINLPDNIHLADQSRTVRGPGDELIYSRVSSGHTMTLNYNYRTLCDSVAPSKVAEHIRARRQMIDCTGLSLGWMPWAGQHAITMPARPRGPAAWIIGIFCVVAVGVFVFIKRRSDHEAAY